MKQYFFLAFLLVLMSVSLAVDTDYTFQRDRAVDLKVACVSGTSFCSASTVCSLTVNYPNFTVAYNNVTMNNSGTYFNYTTAPFNTIGVYEAYALCNDGGNVNYNLFNFEITDNGIKSSPYLFITSIGIIALILIIASFVFGGETKISNIFRLTLLLFALLFLALIPAYLVGGDIANILFDVYITFAVIALLILMSIGVYAALKHLGIINEE